MLKGHSRAVAVGATAFATAILTASVDSQLTLIEVVGSICTATIAVAALYLQPPMPPPAE